MCHGKGAEENTGESLRPFDKSRKYVAWILPHIVLFIFVMGYWNKFFD